MNQWIRIKITAHQFRRSWLLRLGGAAALVSGLMLLIGMISFIFTILRTGISSVWLALFQNNWLIAIFKLHGNFSGMKADLKGMNLLDILFLFLGCDHMPQSQYGFQKSR